MQLFVANCTAQNLSLFCRVPEARGLINQTVPSGFNRPVGDKNLSTPAIDAIIDQHAKYGMVEYGKHEQAMRDGIQLTAIFRRDEVVPPGLIQEIIARNRKDLTEEGDRRRQNLAVVAARVMDPNPDASERVSVTIEEAERGTMSTETGSKLEKGYVGPNSQTAKELGLSEKGSKRGRR